ncbi:class F sortase [Tersicoccus sp. MR15.9]|uniref:class F sortase n=1 Tax=Tersicoccus mangrovi TaxID=3121635 RepID=UPI002FE67736
MPASKPTRLDIPSIGVSTDLIDLGRQDDGSVAVPPGEAGSPAGWYDGSPTPGQQGPAVILGHVNTTTIPEGVFFRLHEMKPGDQFSVTRADGRVAVFQVDRLQSVRKDTFPTLQVYGNTSRSEIRLITCGDYQASSDRWEENTIVFGHLIGSHR